MKHNPHQSECGSFQRSVNPVAWNQVTLTFTATATSEYLTFLAWGNGGSNANQPPTVFLAGVNGASAPEPATLSIMGVALAGLGGLVSRRRAKRNAAV